MLAIGVFTAIVMASNAGSEVTTLRKTVSSNTDSISSAVDQVKDLVGQIGDVNAGLGKLAQATNDSLTQLAEAQNNTAQKAKALEVDVGNVKKDIASVKKQAKANAWKINKANRLITSNASANAKANAKAAKANAKATKANGRFREIKVSLTRNGRISSISGGGISCTDGVCSF